MKSLETRLSGVLSRFDTFSLPEAEQKIIEALRQNVVDARLDIRDYELSETRAGQLQKAEEARQRLEHVRKGVLAASEYNVFSATDVAHLSAQLEQIIENIR